MKQTDTCENYSVVDLGLEDLRQGCKGRPSDEVIIFSQPW